MSIDLANLEPLEPESYVPLYVQLADRFARLIATSDRLAPGTQLPSELECMRHFGISRPTVRQAMARLLAQGLIQRARGRGTYVAQTEVEHDITFSFEEEMLASRYDLQLKPLSWKLVEPSPSVIAALRLPAGERVYRLERLRLIDGEPIGREVRFVTQETGREFAASDLQSRPVFVLLQKVVGHKIARIAFTIRCIGASKRDARLLKVKTGAPLLEREHTYYAANAVPLLHGTVVFLGSRYRFHFETGSGQLQMGSKFETSREQRAKGPLDAHLHDHTRARGSS